MLWKRWGVYLLFFTKHGSRPRLYIGSRTAFERGIVSRMLYTERPARIEGWNNFPKQGYRYRRLEKGSPCVTASSCFIVRYLVLEMRLCNRHWGCFY